MSDFGIRNTPSLTPIKPSTPPVPTAPVPASTETGEAKTTEPVKPASVAPPAEPIQSPGDEAEKDVDKGLHHYEKKDSGIKFESYAGLKSTLMEDYGKYKDISKLSLSTDFKATAKLAKINTNSSLNLTGSASPGVSMKNYTYKGTDKTAYTADFSVGLNPHLKTKLGDNYLKVGPTMNATASYDMADKKTSFDMTLGGEATFQKKGSDWSFTGFYGQSTQSGQGMGGLKVSYNIGNLFGK